MDVVLENVVALVKQHQNGIPLKKLSQFYNQTYHTNLTIRDLNFNSMQSMIASLEELVMEGQVVFHKEHRRQGQEAAADGHRPAPSQAETSTKAQPKQTQAAVILENVVDLVKEHPEGIPLKKLEIFYDLSYKQNLSLSDLGFKNISCLVESLKEDLVVKQKRVFHKIYLPGGQPLAETSANIREASRPTTPQRAECLQESRNGNPPAAQVAASQLDHNLIGSPLMASVRYIPGNPPLTASQPAIQLSQDQLLQRVMEVCIKYISVVTS